MFEKRQIAAMTNSQMIQDQILITIMTLAPRERAFQFKFAKMFVFCFSITNQIP